MDFSIHLSKTRRSISYMLVLQWKQDFRFTLSLLCYLCLHMSMLICILRASLHFFVLSFVLTCTYGLVSAVKTSLCFANRFQLAFRFALTCSPADAKWENSTWRLSITQYRECTVGPLKSERLVQSMSHNACYYHKQCQSIAFSGQ